MQTVSIYSEQRAEHFAKQLLQAEAVRLAPETPFTWASGWKSPIYCDNRKLLAFPDIRRDVKEALCEMIRTQFAEAEVVAGVATGAIAMGALVADALNLPFVYVRPKPKDHGMGNQIEGQLSAGARVIVVEDLISTGGSSLKAVETLRKADTEVMGMVASFTYGFPIAEEAFEEAGVRLITISDYPHVLHAAAQQGYITEEQQSVLRTWRENPAEWNI